MRTGGRARPLSSCPRPRADSPPGQGGSRAAAGSPAGAAPPASGPPAGTPRAPAPTRRPAPVTGQAGCLWPHFTAPHALWRGPAEGAVPARRVWGLRGALRARPCARARPAGGRSLSTAQGARRGLWDGGAAAGGLRRMLTSMKCRWPRRCLSRDASCCRRALSSAVCSVHARCRASCSSSSASSTSVWASRAPRSFSDCLLLSECCLATSSSSLRRAAVQREGGSPGVGARPPGLPGAQQQGLPELRIPPPSLLLQARGSATARQGHVHTQPASLCPGGPRPTSSCSQSPAAGTVERFRRNQQQNLQLQISTETGQYKTS